MRIKRENLRWSIVNGIPIIVLCIVGLVADFVGWDSLVEGCERWIKEIKGNEP